MAENTNKGKSKEKDSRKLRINLQIFGNSGHEKNKGTGKNNKWKTDRKSTRMRKEKYDSR